MSKARCFKFLILIFLFLFSSAVFSEALSQNEEKALAYLRELTFEVTRYNITGHSPLPESSALSKISRTGTVLFSRHKISDFAKNPVYLCEFYNPDYMGIIYSTFCDEDLYSMSEDSSEQSEILEFDWVDQVIMGLLVPEGFVKNPQAGVDYGVIDGEKLLEILEKDKSANAAEIAKLTKAVKAMSKKLK